ncbi:MAG: MoaD/ThiS family protein [Candidatus Thorarchaeota archaeon]|jgi:molybdopterin converting factor small subunit
MQVQVKLYATLRRFAPDDVELGNAFPMDIDEATVGGVLKRLGIETHQAKIIMVNGVRVTDLDHELSQNDMIVIFPPVGGG